MEVVFHTKGTKNSLVHNESCPKEGAKRNLRYQRGEGRHIQIILEKRLILIHIVMVDLGSYVDGG